MKVIVYRFEVYDIGTDDYVVQPSKRTADSIKEIPTARIIDGTAEEVDHSALDDDGRYVASKSEASSASRTMLENSQDRPGSILNGEILERRRRGDGA